MTTRAPTNEPQQTGADRRQTRAVQGIVSRFIRVEITDIWHIFAASAARPPVFAWADSTRGLRFVAWGVAAELSIASAPDPGAAAAWCSALNERWQGEDRPLATVPLAVGGFRFSNVQSPDADWQGWPGTRLFVPRYLAFRHESGECGLIVRSANVAGASPHMLAATDVQGVLPARLQWHSHPTEAVYRSLVQHAVNDITAGDLQKVVVARRASANPPSGYEFDAVASTLALSKSHHGATNFALSLDGSSIFTGATPETLVAVERGALTTHAVAGTSEIAADPHGHGLLTSAKNRHEQALVGDGIAAALEPICRDISVGAPAIKRAGTVQHLASAITATLKADLGVLDAVATLHPTAALCGTPTAAAATWLNKHEPFDRGWYGAPIGWVSGDGDGVFAVAIRSALICPERATTFAGAGIVRSSCPEDEWRETEAKLRTADSALRTRGIA